jgi:L-threonylcarbamoyladenylate synthase
MTEDLVAAAAARLRAGGVVAFPTDTVTGLGCLARSAEAVRAIFALKGREDGKPLTLFVADAAAAEAVTGPLDPRVGALLRLAWPGALTAVLPLTGQWPDGVGRAGTVGVRVPAHPVPRALVDLAGGPLATTSANVSGEAPWRDAAEAAARWGEAVLAVPGASGAVPSTVVDLTAWPPRVLREGAVGADLLAKWIRAAG